MLRVDAVMVLSYSLAKQDISRLTIMSHCTMQEAISFFQSGGAQYFICTAITRQEKKIKIQMLKKAGIPMERVIVFQPVKDTFDEARQARQTAEERGLRSILLVAEQMHMSRAKKIFKKCLPSDVELSTQSVQVLYYEMELYGDKSWLLRKLKELRSSSKFTRQCTELLLRFLIALKRKESF